MILNKLPGRSIVILDSIITITTLLDRLVRLLMLLRQKELQRSGQFFSRYGMLAFFTMPVVLFPKCEVATRGHLHTFSYSVVIG